MLPWMRKGKEGNDEKENAIIRIIYKEIPPVHDLDLKTFRIYFIQAIKKSSLKIRLPVDYKPADNNDNSIMIYTQTIYSWYKLRV